MCAASRSRYAIAAGITSCGCMGAPGPRRGDECVHMRGWGLARACARRGDLATTVDMAWRSLGLCVVMIGCGGGAGEATGEGPGGGGASSGEPATGSSGEVTASSSGGPAGSSSGGGETPTTGEPGTTGPGESSGDTSAGETGVMVTDVPVFLAQGHHGRTTISCDDGHTWVQDHSQDDAVRCFENDLDCDHSEFAGRGIAWGDGQFVLTWGWGHPGTLTRSEDAFTFATVMTDTPTFADVAFGNGRFVANNSPTRISDDGGKTWAEGGQLDIDINTRAIEFVPHEAGYFIVAGESGEQRAIVRSPDGVTWTAASMRPEPCGSYTLGMAYGDGATVMVSGNGFVCRSLDGGDTWMQILISERLTSPPIWTGTEFFVYEGNTVHYSADGAQWSSQQLVGDDLSIGQVARSPEGTFVAANDGWMVWYEKQKFYRSEDGKVWETLPEGAYVGSHPIYFMAYGRVKPGQGCAG